MKLDPIEPFNEADRWTLNNLTGKFHTENDSTIDWRNGQSIKIIGRLTDEDYDRLGPYVGSMWRVRFPDGHEASVYGDEIASDDKTTEKVSKVPDVYVTIQLGVDSSHYKGDYEKYAQSITDALRKVNGVVEIEWKDKTIHRNSHPEGNPLPLDALVGNVDDFKRPPFKIIDTVSFTSDI
jgi:hypothetical protein